VSRSFYWANLFVGDIYGNLALQVGGVSDETVKYGYGFCAIIDYTANCKLVVSSGRATHRNKAANFRQQHTDEK
jgi:hypothetical protein